MITGITISTYVKPIIWSTLAWCLVKKGCRWFLYSILAPWWKRAMSYKNTNKLLSGGVYNGGFLTNTQTMKSIMVLITMPRLVHIHSWISCKRVICSPNSRCIKPMQTALFWTYMNIWELKPNKKCQLQVMIWGKPA